MADTSQEKDGNGVPVQGREAPVENEITEMTASEADAPAQADGSLSGEAPQPAAEAGAQAHGADAPERSSDTQAGGTDAHTAGQTGETGSGEDASGRFGMLSGESMTFAQRMSGAGYVTGRRYDAIKNELLRYRHPRTGKGVRAKLSKTGENFSFGRKTLAMLRVSGATLRLFLALDPAKYSGGRYHHKDMSATARYARCPMLLRLTSDRQVRYAQELIGKLMRENGLEEDPDYVACDQAGAFGKPKRQKRVYVRVPAPASVAGARGRSAAERAADPVAEEIAAAAPVQEAQLPPEAVKARLPRRGSVYDRFGEKIGVLRRGVWYGAEKEEKGAFREQGEGVLYYPSGQDTALAYLDGNGNLLTSLHKHVATIKRSRLPLLVLIVLCAALALLAVLLGALAVPHSAEPYAPTIFLTDEEGTHWSEQEDLSVFFNEEFGDAVIAPGMSGAYRFVFENANEDAVEYSLTFREENEYGIALKYRLVRDGAPVTGEEYLPAGELGVTGLTLEARSSALFELQWYWEHNDEADTAAGAAGASYTLHIGLTAAVRGQ